MIKYVALYRDGGDGAALDPDCARVGLPDVAPVPGLLRTEIARVLATVSGGSALHVVAELYFDSYDAVRAAFDGGARTGPGASLQEWAGLQLVSLRIAGTDVGDKEPKEQ